MSLVLPGWCANLHRVNDFGMLFEEIYYIALESNWFVWNLVNLVQELYRQVIGELNQFEKVMRNVEELNETSG